VGAALNIGSLYLDLRYPDDAAPFFEHVLALDPENDLAHAKLAQARRLARSQPESTRRHHPKDEQTLDLDNLPEPPKKKKKKKRKPFTNLEL
jgi:hypothetical protein